MVNKANSPVYDWDAHNRCEKGVYYDDANGQKMSWGDAKYVIDNNAKGGVNGALVNDAGLSTSEITQITNDVGSIYADNGFDGIFHFDVMSASEGKKQSKNIAGKYDLFIALVDKDVTDRHYGAGIGMSLLDAGANVEGWNEDSKKWISFVNIRMIDYGQNRKQLI